MDRAPNILLLFSDQMRPFELGCYGHPLVKTPHIDRLAADGVRFELACTTNPLCTPARASLLSGQYSRTCQGMLGNVGDPAERRCHCPETTLAERLGVGVTDEAGRAVAYDTALVGKWHIGPAPRLLGFQETIYPQFSHRNSNQLYFDGLGRSWTQAGFCPDFEVATTQAFLRRQRTQPFFLFHNFCLPHMPYYDVPARYRTRYRPEDMLLRPNVWQDGRLYHNEHAFKVYLYDYLYYREHRPEMSSLPAGYDLRSLYADYCGMIAAVDDQVGQILDCLEATGQRENTIVVFASDHGDNLGSQQLWNKHSPNEEAIRIPFIVSWPGQLASRVVTGHVASLADVAPTVLSLAGRAVPPALQGRDLSPVLRGQADRLGAGEAYVENINGEMVVRTPTHLYAVQSQTQAGTPRRKVTDDRHLFYDLQADPFQQHNLAKTDAQRGTADGLREMVLDWDTRTPWMEGSLGGGYGHGP